MRKLTVESGEEQVPSGKTGTFPTRSVQVRRCAQREALARRDDNKEEAWLTGLVLGEEEGYDLCSSGNP